MAKYTMKDFISGKIAVHTGLDSQKFLELCDKHDLKWNHGDKATDWKPKKYGEDTCIVCERGTLMHGFVQLFGTLLAKHIVVEPEDIAEMAPKYTMKDFIEKPIAVRVGQIHKEEFLKMCEAEGLEWKHGDKPTAWVPTMYGDKQCITLHCKYGTGKLMTGDVKCYEEQHLTIVDFADIEPNMHRYQIVINCDDNKVTEARMMVNNKEVKTAIARRNPVDEFDFAIGAKVAFNRLFGKEPSAPVESVEPEPVHKFKVGDRVKCIEVVDRNDAVVGKHGTVKGTYDRRCAVEFDEDVGGHTCSCCTKYKHGWFCPQDALEPAGPREFKVGDRVKCTQVCSGNLRVKNARGTVKIVNEQQIGVEFDEDVGGHTLNKYAPQAKRGRGWYCSPEVLQHED